MTSSTWDATDEVTQRLQQVFQEVFSDPDLVLTPATTAADVAGWDSLGHIGLMFSIEAAFGVTFTDAEMSRLEDVGELRDVLREKLGR
ncbi:acyl carrier protein [Geodermatophilus nigrescens]